MMISLRRATAAIVNGGDIGLGWYAVALGVYILAGFFLKSAVLNWIVGPLFPLAVLYAGPALLRRRGASPTGPAEPAE